MKQFVIKFKFIALSTLLFVGIGNIAAAQQVISLQQAVDLTLKNNLTIKQAQVTEAVASEDYQQAKYNRLPAVSANPQAGYYFGRSQVAGAFAYASSALNVNGQVSAQVTLFQGGQLRNQILQNKLLLDVDKTNTAKVKNDLVLNVVTDYLTILTNQDLVIAAKQQIAIANLTLDRSQKNVDAGNQTVADLAQARAQVSTAELNLTTAQNQYDLSLLILKQYMEMNPNTDIVVEKPDISKLNDIKTAYDENEVIKTALTVNPDIHLAELQQQTYAEAIKIAKGNYYPTLSLFAGLATSYSNQLPSQIIGYNTVQKQIGFTGPNSDPVYSSVQVPIVGPYSAYNQLSNNFNQSIGLNLQIPIFNRYSARTSVRKAKLNYQSAELNTQIAKNNLSKTIIQATLDLHAADKRYQSALQTYQSNKEAFNVITQRYNVGLVNSLDYNTSLTNYNKSQNDMIEAKYEVIFRSKVIDYYLGNPISL